MNREINVKWPKDLEALLMCHPTENEPVWTFSSRKPLLSQNVCPYQRPQENHHG